MDCHESHAEGRLRINAKGLNKTPPPRLSLTPTFLVRCGVMSDIDLAGEINIVDVMKRTYRVVVGCTELWSAVQSCGGGCTELLGGCTELWCFLRCCKLL